MFDSLIYTLRVPNCLGPLAPWRRDLAYRWGSLGTDSLIFFSALALVTVVGAFTVYFSIAGHGVIRAGHDSMRAEQVRIQAEHVRNQELNCLALNVYHEARGEPLLGQFAVAEVTINRVVSRRYPNTVCEVVYEKRWDRIRKRYVGAFSWTELNTTQELRTKEWNRAMKAAEAIYYERQEPMLEGALFYHAKSIRPSWAKQKRPVARIGMHIFYL
ncbi:MAG: hypothetical protein GWN21_12135 [Gammaproteobacteria bacterium]|nr:cell wall hydrolase [Gammaproteobacteria bacterium]NIP89164.1 cell wall hydrolase [Gammaproteobacteria bacterium]NIR24023.1 cell wall hydrolase [Gammaproteobacteria bacterium]NIU40972.1 hypothetical protein [Gammaproteobacteria bacterium]NIV48317.1 hypothetical protein [Gammaproteobacteria bacterium]